MAEAKRPSTRKNSAKKPEPPKKPVGWGIDQAKYDAARRKS